MGSRFDSLRCKFKQVASLDRIVSAIMRSGWYGTIVEQLRNRVRIGRKKEYEYYIGKVSAFSPFNFRVSNI